MNLEIPEIQTILNKLDQLTKEIGQNSKILSQQFYNDEQCWNLKGGMALTTYRSNRYFQCKGGIPDAYVGGRKVWTRESVLEWIHITDDMLDEYHQKYKTGAKRK